MPAQKLKKSSLPSLVRPARVGKTPIKRKNDGSTNLALETNSKNEQENKDKNNTNELKNGRNKSKVNGMKLSEKQKKSLRYSDISKELPRHKTRSYNWRARSKIKKIVVHTTDWNTTPKTIAQYDITPFFMVNGKKIYNHISKKGCPEITYHDIIMSDGFLYHTCDYNKITWHAGKWNTQSVAVALMYKTSNKDKSLPDYRPSNKSISRLTRHLVSMCLVLGVLPKDIRGHRELESTGWEWKLGDNGKKTKSLIKWCPGQFVDLSTLRWDVTRRIQQRLKREGYYTGAIDGIFGNKSIKALRSWKPKEN